MGYPKGWNAEDTPKIPHNFLANNEKKGYVEIVELKISQ
jgi:hypothetical protein